MLTVKQAAELTGLDTSRIRRCIAAGQLAASRFGGDPAGPWQIQPKELERFMATPRPRGVKLRERPAWRERQRDATVGE